MVRHKGVSLCRMVLSSLQDGNGLPFPLQISEAVCDPPLGVQPSVQPQAATGDKRVRQRTHAQLLQSEMNTQ